MVVSAKSSQRGWSGSSSAMALAGEVPYFSEGNSMISEKWITETVSSSATSRE
jgi:hypothetical protein